MDIGIISRRYAKALFKYACKHGEEDNVYSSTAMLLNSYIQYPALRRTLESPILPIEQKEKLIFLASGGDACDEFMNFIRLVIKQEREDVLQTICLSYQGIYRKEKGILSAELITAIEIDKDTEKQIVGKLEELTHQQVSLSMVVKPEILGGYIVRWETYQYDASVASQLKRIKKDLKSTLKLA